jgi:hypothetical protein
MQRESFSIVEADLKTPFLPAQIILPFHRERRALGLCDLAWLGGLPRRWPKIWMVLAIGCVADLVLIKWSWVVTNLIVFC